MKKNQNLRAIQAQRFLRYSIRKFTVGVASVAIASGLAVLGGTNVQAAAEEVVNTHATETKAPETGKNIKTEVAEKVNTSKLSEAIERLSQLLGKVTETEKTTTTITAAKELLSKAQQAVSRSDIQQLEVDKFTSELTSKAFVLESMPKEKDKKTEKEADKSTEEKVNKNQDPRNGKAIPGKGESGFRADTSGNGGTTTVTNDELTPTTPAKPTAKNIIGSTSTVSRENFTGWDTYKMPFGVQSGSGTLGVDSAEQKANAEGLQFRVFSDQRAGTRVTPGPSNFTFELQPSDVKARVDYGLKLPAEEVQKIIEEAPLWRGKLKYNNTRIQSSAASTYFGGGPYEYLLSSIYKLGYEQGIDKVYVKDASKRIEVTEEAKAAGWTVSDFTVSNMPGGLVYDKQSDSIQGVVTHSSPFNYQKLVATVTFTNTKTGKNVRIPLDLHRYGGTAWKDGTPPTLEINDAVKEGKVGEELVVPVEYRDAGASHAGAPNGRNIPYSLTDENGNPLNRTATIRETVGRAILGVSGVKITGTTGAGASTVTDLTGDDTKIPGVGFTIASNDMTERNKNGFKGTPTEAGIYRVSIYARDYKETNANEAYAHATFKISPAVSVKNVHAYDKEVPITISRGASEATITLPDGTNTKVVAKDGKWVVTETTNTAVNVNDEIGTVGETFNLKVLPTATAKAATDNIKVTASSENVTATFTRAEVALKTKLGENVTATFNKVTGRWDLPAEIAEKKTVNSDGTTTWLKRDLYVDVDKNGETIFNVYEYTRTLNAEGKVTAVSDPTRTLTTYNKENASNSAAESANDTNKGMIVTVKYNKGLNKWTADDNSTVTATKTGDKWTISTSSGFNGTVDAVYAESSDKASVLNDAPAVHSTSYTTVKGATVDLVKQKSATVTITDREDDATTAPNKKETTVTKVTLTAPSGKVTEYTSLAAAAAVKLTETGEYTVKVDVKDSNGNKVTADSDSDTATGTNENDNSAVASTTYVITVKDQETNKLYKVEDDTVTNDELKAKVNPTTVDGFTPSKNDITDIPTTTGKAGQTLPTPATVTYTKDTETIQVETKVDVVVLPKVTPTGVTVLKDSTNLENVVKEKAKEAVKAIATDKIPTGVTVSIKEVKTGTLPGTTTIGDQTPAKVVVEYKDANNNVVETREVEVPVTVVGSTVNKIVKFEDDDLTDEEVKAAVTPGTNGTKGEPLLEANITAEPGTKEVAIPVTYNNGELSERVVVPVVVLPTATGEVEVPKGSTVDKVKEVTKAKATEVATSADFKAKLPEGSKDVVVGEITEEVLAKITAEKGTNKGIVKVPVTYTVDGKTYTKDAEITVNVLGSEAKPVYTLEGTKPDAEKVKNAVTPGNGGTVNAPTEAGLPETTGKAGAKDVTVPTTVTYPTGDETVNVPVEVLPKATPEKVTTLKDTTSDNLTTTVKEKAQAALGKLTLPSGVTVELVPNQDYTVPATDSNGDKTAVPVKVQYKDATGTVVAEDTINVPVTVVSSTPSKIVVFEGEKPTATQAKEAVTPGADGTKGEPTTLPETAGKAGATDVKVDVPVTYDNGKLTETVSVPVTVLPKATGEA
ncbi:YSIRK-type signal peptide-containing protein, partial [uncultured Granulicatella sp.]|uniref:YSIRK-type signal peptide-containing protein n=1 Tax=uncultured Granulicatella sp. TaxID=316089 RepID=UPI0028D3FA4C